MFSDGSTTAVSSLYDDYLFMTKAIMRAMIIPMRTEPMNTIVKFPRVEKISAVLESVAPADITESNMTSAIASLKMDSPKTIAFRFSFASISLKMDSTDTGSVALIRLPKANASYQVSLVVVIIPIK